MIQASMGNLSMTLKNGATPLETDPDLSEAYTLVKSVVSNPFPNGFSDPTIFQFLMAQLLVDVTSKPQNFTPAWNLTLCSVDWCGRVYENVQVTKGNLTQPPATIVQLQPNTTSECYNSTTCQDFIATNPVVNATYFINSRPDSRNIRELLNFDQDVNSFNNNTWDVSDALTVTASLFWNINITSAIAQACDTFTDFMRSDHETGFAGTTLTDTTYIRVQWGWIALPATIVVCTLVLLLLVIMVNRGTMLWKDSSLPLLLHPLDYPGQNQISRTDAQPSAMNKQANAMQVKLVHRDDGGAAFLVTSNDLTPRRAQTGGPSP